MIEIKNSEGIVLYASETASDLRAAVVEAVGKKANLGGANLREANLGGANLRGADLRWANLGGANLREANLYGADLRWADLRWADLGEANLCGANLRGANLRWANLRGANLGEANLYGANFRGANLCWANLREANLYRANLREANLCWADLGGADLGGARCSSVLAEKCDRIFTASSGSGYQMVFVRHPDGISVHAGCRDFESIAKASEHWREGKGHDPKHLADCLSALDHLTALAKRRGWTLPEEDSEAAA